MLFAGLLSVTLLEENSFSVFRDFAKISSSIFLTLYAIKNMLVLFGVLHNSPVTKYNMFQVINKNIECEMAKLIKN